MNCRELNEALEALWQPNCAAEVREAAEKHVASCVPCRRLFEAAEGMTAYLPPEEQVEMTRSIMARTSGSACGRARERLGDLVDGALSSLEAEIISSHLAYCSECALLATTLAELQWVLPRMAELEPGEAFTRAVLHATRTYVPPWGSHSERFHQLGRRLVQRPRFALEAAYVATLLMVLLLGRPAVSMLGAAPRTFGIVKVELGQTLQSLPSRIPNSWRRTDSEPGRFRMEVAHFVTLHRQAIERSLSGLLGRGQAWQSAIATLNLRTAWAYLREASSALKRFWLSLLNNSFPKPRKKSPVAEP